MTTQSTDARRFIDRLTSKQRKQFPMCTGLVDYAPDALAAIAHISYVGDRKHNPNKGEDEPPHHSRGKSADHADCELRHMSTRGDVDPAYADDIIADVFHMAEKAWRAIMELQQAMEDVYGLPLPRGARYDAPEPGEPVRCDARDNDGTQCALMAGHDGDHAREVGGMTKPPRKGMAEVLQATADAVAEADDPRAFDISN